MRTMHLFAGAGGGLLADLILGHTPVVAVEWDAYCCQVLRERAEEGWFPGLQVWEGDVRLFDPSDWAGRVDCIHAGFPCQDISLSGSRLGTDGDRSGLYREVIRVAGAVRPKFIFMENVPAIVGGGLGDVLADLASMGMDARWACVPASAVGCCHARNRWWLLANDASGNGLEKAEIVDRPSVHQPWKEACRRQFERAIGAAFRPVGDAGYDGIDDDLAVWMDRCKAIGNGQVPLQAALAWRILTA